jgi:hypothetical protein
MMEEEAPEAVLRVLRSSHCLPSASLLQLCCHQEDDSYNNTSKIKKKKNKNNHHNIAKCFSFFDLRRSWLEDTAMIAF